MVSGADRTDRIASHQPIVYPVFDLDCPTFQKLRPYIFFTPLAQTPLNAREVVFGADLGDLALAGLLQSFPLCLQKHETVL